MRLGPFAHKRNLLILGYSVGTLSRERHCGCTPVEVSAARARQPATMPRNPPTPARTSIGHVSTRGTRSVTEPPSLSPLPACEPPFALVEPISPALRTHPCRLRTGHAG
eukprot:3652212-Prymnesium_polylepis.1